MIVLDTNVVSEVMRSANERSPTIGAWLRRVLPTQLFVTAPGFAEILVGLAIMPDGRRKSGLARAAEAFATQFADRILPFDFAAARIFAEIHMRRRSLGLATPTVDLQIAAIARSVGMAIATRNVTDFQECGVEVLNPWTA